MPTRSPAAVATRTAPPRPRRRWRRLVLRLAFAGLAVLAATGGYYYALFSQMIDARLSGGLQRTDPRIFARPFELRRGQALTPRQLVDRLNDLGYAHRARPSQPGEFTVGREAVVLVPRAGDRRGQVVRVAFAGPPNAAKEPTHVERIEAGGAAGDVLTLDSPLITALVTSAREKRRDTPLEAIPPQMIRAVLAIEDRRFYDHAGIDPIGIAGALYRNIFGDKAYLASGSTISQQLVKNTFLTSEKTVRRKVTEWFMSIVLERRLSKDQILELYLNDVALGQRGSFAIHGVAEASRLFFAKDVSNLSLAEAATIAGVIQSPSRLSPFNNPDRAKDRRNVVLRSMAAAGHISPDAAERASREPLGIVARALDAEAPYFVDYVSQRLREEYGGGAAAGAVDVHTSLDLHLQRLAHEAVREGLGRVDDLLARRKRQPAQAALVAVDPRTGDVLALVGGRTYNQSQYNRATNARRQPGSVFKPFVFLAAFEQARANGRVDITPGTVLVDEPVSFELNQQTWTPGNYDGQFEGPVTLRRTLALSRNIPTIKLAQETGYEEVARLWRSLGIGTPPRPYPSIALGVFEATPLEIAGAFTLFANGGVTTPLRPLLRLERDGRELPVTRQEPRRIAGPDTTYLVTNLMRSVLNEGTGASARAAGFSHDGAGKSGTTNDLRDAWFVGFTPELLTVVWVGLDDNQPLGLSGTQAALPIWTAFMSRALAGRPNRTFEPPDGISFVDIDRDTGKLAGPSCPRVFREAFLAHTEPTDVCRLHTIWF